MPSNLNDLGSTPLNDAVDFANMPEERTTFAPHPPSGSYRFQLPRLDSDAFGKVVTRDQGDRVKVQFHEDYPLLIVQTPEAFKDQYLNTPFQTTITNATRKRGKGDDAPVASDWDYLNRALGEPKRPASNLEFAQKLIAQSQATPPKTFGADIEGSYFCNDERNARFFDDNTKSYVEIPEANDDGTPKVDGEGKPQMMKGCGMRFYEGDATGLPTGSRKSGTIGKVNGLYPNTVDCPKCGANMRRFANLTRFKA